MKNNEIKELDRVSSGIYDLPSSPPLHRSTTKNRASAGWEFAMYFIYSVIVAHFFPVIIARIAFLPLLIIAYRSKNVTVWIALLIVFLGRPLFLFNAGEAGVIGRTPFYPFPFGGITFDELLAIVLLFKSMRNFKVSSFYKKDMIFLYLAVLLATLVTLEFDLTVDSLLIAFRRLLMWTFLLSMPRLMYSKESWITLVKLLIPIVFFMLIDQMYIYAYARPILSRYISSVTLGNEDQLRIAEEGIFAIRVLSGYIVNFIAFVGSMVIINIPKTSLQTRAPFYLVIIVCFIQVLLSATRGWFIAYSVMLMMLMFTSETRMLRNRLIPYAVAILIIFILAVNTIPSLSNQYRLAGERLGTVQLLTQGDVTAGGTLDRYNAKYPALLRRINGNFIGFGFTNTAYSKEDEHVGFANPIVIFGVLGYLFIILFITSFEYTLYVSYLSLSSNNPYKKTLLTACIPIIGLMIIHVSSTQIFGLNIASAKNMLTPVIFSILNMVLVEARSWSPALH